MWITVNRVTMFMAFVYSIHIDQPILLSVHIKHATVHNSANVHQNLPKNT